MSFLKEFFAKTSGDTVAAGHHEGPSVHDVLKDMASALAALNKGFEKTRMPFHFELLDRAINESFSVLKIKLEKYENRHFYGESPHTLATCEIEGFSGTKSFFLVKRGISIFSPKFASLPAWETYSLGEADTMKNNLSAFVREHLDLTSEQESALMKALETLAGSEPAIQKPAP